MNLFRMLAHAPPVLEGFAKLGGALLFDSTLEPRLREIAILRVGMSADARYEVEKHVAIGKAVGLTEDELTALHPSRGQLLDGAVERAVVRLVDELRNSPRASDEALAGVRAHLSDRAVVELVVTIGYYGLVCRVLETLGVELESVNPPA
jgi:alkylhydroperoxidase family enzyme